MVRSSNRVIEDKTTDFKTGIVGTISRGQKQTGKLEENRNNERYANNSRPQREFNRSKTKVSQMADSRGRRQGGQSDQPFHSQGGRQSGSNFIFEVKMNERNLNFLHR
ncbi:hypothetical protein TNCV_2888421 [Trichonephila clavipes]|nr:hypothetical protein TNCV_2888421 [Trichonephila clavipes]